MIYEGDLEGRTIDIDVRDITGKMHPTRIPDTDGLWEIKLDNGYNPVRMVKINGEWGLMTARYTQPLWSDRDPSRNFEWARDENPNRIVLYWDDEDNPPLVEYGQQNDCGAIFRNAYNGRVRIKVHNAGIGLWLDNCRNITVEYAGLHGCGKGILVTGGQNVYIIKANMMNIGNTGLHIKGDAKNLWGQNITVKNCGMTESIGAVYFGNGVERCKVKQLTADNCHLGNYWFWDGDGVYFEAGSDFCEVVVACISNSFQAVQDNSGMPNNGIDMLFATNCALAFDQNDHRNHGNSAKPEDMIGYSYLQGTMPFGLRLKNMKGGEPDPRHKKRYEYPHYPSRVGYANFNLRRDGVNVVGPIPENYPHHAPLSENYMRGDL